MNGFRVQDTGTLALLVLDWLCSERVAEMGALAPEEMQREVAKAFQDASARPSSGKRRQLSEASDKRIRTTAPKCYYHEEAIVL